MYFIFYIDFNDAVENREETKEIKTISLLAQSNLSQRNSKWHSSSEDWKNDELNPLKTRQYFPCRDRVNFGALMNHQYEIVENPDRESKRNTRIYICKYKDWGKAFTKTWNLIYHFRVHTKEKPFMWEICKKKCSAKSATWRDI